MQSLPAETELACHVNRIALSDEEDDDYDDCLYDDEASGQVNRYGSDGEEDEPVIPEQALELLKMEQVIRSGYILKKGEKRRVSSLSMMSMRRKLTLDDVSCRHGRKDGSFYGQPSLHFTKMTRYFNAFYNESCAI